MLWLRISLRQGILDTTFCDKGCQWLEVGRWISLCTPVSSTNKTDRQDITEILLKVALNTKTLTLIGTLTWAQVVANLIKISAVSIFILFWQYTNIARVRIFNEPIRDEPIKFLDNKTMYMPRAVIRLVNIFNCLAYDWTVKDEWKVTWHDPKQDVVRY